MSYCLDAWAVLAWLEEREPVHECVDEVLASERPTISWINLGEVFHLVSRRRSGAGATEVVGQLRPALTLELPTESRVLETAAIEARHTVAYADAFAVATAIANGAVLSPATSRPWGPTPTGRWGTCGHGHSVQRSER